MAQVKKNRFNFESDEIKQKYLNEIIGFFQTERGEEIGLIAAEQALDFFVETMGDEIYRKALQDAKKLLAEKIQDLEVELDLLSPK